MADTETAVRLKSSVVPRSMAAAPLYGSNDQMQYDPGAQIQTGPGLPGWQPFETVRFGWSGPVTRDQNIGFTLIGPGGNCFLAFVRVLMIIGLAIGLFSIQVGPKTGFRIPRPGSLAIAAILGLIVFFPAIGQTADFPSPDMLKQLEERLLEKDDCFPACAVVSNAFLQIKPDELSLRLQIEAQIDTAVPIPGNVTQWLPANVLVDGRQAQGLFRDNGYFWLMVPEGRHDALLTGPLRRQNAFQLPFNLSPKHLDIKADGWSVDGIHSDGTFDDQLQFKRVIKSDDTQSSMLETGILPPFARIERTLSLGLVWKIRTRVQRLSPPDSGMVLDIPLLPGESVTTQGIRVKNQTAKINFRTGQRELRWDSFLEETSSIQLVHPETTEWTEVWKVDVSPIFHMEYKGIPVIHHKQGSRWYPTWHPWPGERVTLKISRPQGAKGRTLTIEKSHLELWPGQNASRAQLTLDLKSSQGGQHTITLPQGARLQEVRIKGRVHPIRQNDRQVTLPFVPGDQNIELSWMNTGTMPAHYQSPNIDLGIDSVNTSIDVHLPLNRWPLFTGGDLLVGPAVLFWSVLIIIVLVAAGLHKTGWASLKFYHWFLLLIGMSMSPLWAGLLVVAWLVALDFRSRANDLEDNRFNLVQVGLVILSFAALAALVSAVSNGLLGHPDMNIQGNGSRTSLLRWYHDMSGPSLPRARVISIPMFFYRAAMLVWALWVSFWLVGTLKWGWQRFSNPKLWQKIEWRRKKEK